MDKLTFCIPSKNNLRYLISSIKSIRQNSSLDNEIIVWVDQDNDGTVKWLEENNIKFLINPDANPQGIAAGYNRCIKAASNNIVCMFHADMFMGRGFDINILKHLTKGRVVAGTRIEPPLHPEGKEKIVRNFGMYPEEFSEMEFDRFVELVKEQQKDEITYGVFAPWACFKSDIEKMGMHDENFHSYYEDSDIFNRFILNKMEVLQSRDALVYHLTCRGGIFQDGVEQITKDQKFHNMKSRAAKHYIRKWGSWIENDEYQYPIITPKYNIGFSVKGANLEAVRLLEPFCDRLYIEDETGVLASHYCDEEQKNTKFDLRKRVVSLEHNTPEDYEDIVVEFDWREMDNQTFQIIQKLPKIIKDSGEVGKFILGKLSVTIISMNEYQNELIYLKR
jgi:glycosyltransferase involved in cell wall biosynthesis